MMKIYLIKTDDGGFLEGKKSRAVELAKEHGIYDIHVWQQTYHPTRTPKRQWKYVEHIVIPNETKDK